MESDSNGKGLQTCPYCKKVFKQLFRHKCKKMAVNEVGPEEKQDPDRSRVKETTPKLYSRGITSETRNSQFSPSSGSSIEQKSNQRSSSSLTSATTGGFNGDSIKKCFISPDECSGSTLKPIPEQSDGKGTETCPDCGKSFKCLANHKKCKMRNEEMGADNLKRSQTAQRGAQNLDIRKYEKRKLPYVGSLTNNCEPQEERENKIGTKDERIGSRRLELHDLEPSPLEKHMERASSVEQCNALTSCPYCGKGIKHVQQHVRSCKKNPSNTSCATYVDENNIHSESVDQAQQKQNQSKWPEQKRNILEMQYSIELSSSTAEDENAEVPCCNQNYTRNNGYLIQRNALLTPMSINSDTLGDISYSEDPKAELVRLQAGNIIDEVEISNAEEVVKEMEDHFLRKLNEHSSFKWTIFRTGSYSDETKIKSANEFDFIVSLGIKSTVKFLEDPNTLGYCLVLPIPELNVSQEISPLMTGIYLDPVLVKEMAFKLFDKVRMDEDFRKGRRMKRLHRDGGSPAFTIGYSAGGGKEYDIDLVPAIHFDGWPHISAIRDWQPKWRHRHSLQELKKDYFAVARENPNAKTLRQRKLLWRLSFSRTEKMLWLSADSKGSMRTCRKDVLKILKGILEDCKDSKAVMMPNLSSFHLRTFMLHQYDQRPDDNDWLETKTRQCLHVCIGELIQILNSTQMSNYYVRGHNVLQNVKDEEIKIFTEALIKATATY
ncbi:hypothetical protein CHS0354_020278 [Potamilus streckersoni]|uniref:Uncharacterized protein n=1 Tax=Potamilus streckersoni TaxID=2493646 RepID=A0AAE0S5G0_9BIVA|nr:hypothetical protein CHS0354_020278 [Potamilus streckersoni]